MKKLLIAIYVLIAIATFGDAVVFFDKKGIEEINLCKKTYPNNEYCMMYKSTGNAAFFSTVAWPLYWSYRINMDDAP